MKFYCCILFFIVGAVQAQIFEYVTTSKSGTIYSLDPASIIIKEGVVTYVQLLDYPNGYDSSLKNIRSIKHTKEIDCSQNLSRTLSMIAYGNVGAKGNIQDAHIGKESSWEKINENSILSLFRDEVCK